jgi:hypothetical protein
MEPKQFKEFLFCGCLAAPISAEELRVIGCVDLFNRLLVKYALYEQKSIEGGGNAS